MIKPHDIRTALSVSPDTIAKTVVCAGINLVYQEYVDAAEVEFGHQAQQIIERVQLQLKRKVWEKLYGELLLPVAMLSTEALKYCPPERVESIKELRDKLHAMLHPEF